MTTQYDAILKTHLGRKDDGSLPVVIGRKAFGYVYEDKMTTGNHPFVDGTYIRTSALVPCTCHYI